MGWVSTFQAKKEIFDLNNPNNQRTADDSNNKEQPMTATTTIANNSNNKQQPTTTTTTRIKTTTADSSLFPTQTLFSMIKGCFLLLLSQIHFFSMQFIN